VELCLKKIYFGHPVNVYGTDLEKFLLDTLRVAFPGREIEDPSQKHHSEGYKRAGMDYFLKEVLPNCDGGVFLPFRDGKWGAGIFKEAKFLAERGFPIWQITPDGVMRMLPNLSQIKVLTVEETRSRIRNASGQLIPY
jgi:hypothetical protein